MKNIKPVDEITISDLDIDRIYDIAKGELSRISLKQMNPFDEPRASAPLADWYLDLYFNDSDVIVGGILDTIEEKLNDDDDIENVLGKAVAHAARFHAVADIDLMSDDFVDRAITFDGDEILDNIK